MAEIIVAKIQNRRGLRVNLPQPLDPGEIGLCLDTGQVFIGADADDPNSIISPVIEVYTPSTQTNADANQVINTQIVQVNLNDPVPNDSDDPVGDLERAIAQTAGVSSDQVTVVIYDEQRNARAYVSYTSPPGSLDPALDVWGPSNWFGVITGNSFVDGILSLGQEYLTDDSFAVADLINKVYNGGNSNGLVTVRQNIEILTEFFDVNLPPDLILDPLEFALTARAGFGSVPNLQYSVDITDAFEISYSIKGEAGTDFTRTGKLTIVADQTTATLMDQSTEINPNDTSVEFLAAKSGSDVVIQYKSSNDITFRTITRRWKSF